MSARHGHDYDPFALLRNAKIQRIEYFPINRIAHRFKGCDDARQSLAVIVGGELADVFNYNNMRAFCRHDTRHFQKQIAARVGKSMARADNAEWLAWKSGKQDVMVRHGVGANGGNIAIWMDTEIALINLASVGVDVGRENTIKAKTGGGGVKAANPTE